MKEPGTRDWRRGRSMVALAGISVAALALSACGGSTTSSDGGSTDSGGDSGGESGATSDVRNPGVIVHAQNGEPATLDPARAEQGEKGEAFIDNVCERLLEVGPDGPELQPSLATEVPTQENGLVSADRLVYTFPLREGVKIGRAHV